MDNNFDIFSTEAHCYKFSSRYTIHSYSLHKNSFRNISKGQYSINKGKQSILYVTDCLNPCVIHIDIRFPYDIPKGYLVMGCEKIDLKNNQ